MIQEKLIIKSYVGEEIEVWMRDSETRKILGFASFELKDGHFNCRLQSDQYTQVAELILKTHVSITSLDKEIIIEQDEDFLKKIE